MFSLELAACLLLLLPAEAAVNFPTIPADLTTPVQQRLAFKSPTEMSVGWNTYEHLAKPCVKYGTSSSSLTKEACSTSSITYNTSRTYSNAVTLTGLKPATTYYYKIVSGNSTTDFFTSPRAAGDKTAFAMDVVIDLGVYGENGYTTSGSTAAKRQAIPKIQPELNHSTIGALANTVNEYEFVIHPGDFAYADDWIETPSNYLDGSAAYEAILENFYDQLAPVAGRKAYMASPGNHEADCEEINFTSALCPEGQTNFTDFMNRFGRTMPSTFPSKSTNKTLIAHAANAAKLANPPFWYSFEYGMVHIAMFDTETDFANAPDGIGGSADLETGPFGAPKQQTDFLRADLASVDRSITPWVIVAGHRPWYTLGGSPCTSCQDAFEDIFYDANVDLAIFGHVHNSQRFEPIYNGTVDPAGYHNPRAPVYIIAGGAGNIEGLSTYSSNTTGNVFAYATNYSYASVEFQNPTHLGIKFFDSFTRDLLDSSVLYKEH